MRNRPLVIFLFAGLCVAVVVGAWLLHKQKLGAEFKSHGLERTRFGFYHAVRKGDVTAVKLFLADGFSPNTRYGKWGSPILVDAARENHLQVCRMLIEAGADVRAADRLGGYQAIHIAAANAHVDILRELLKAGADPNAQGCPTVEGGAFVPIYHAAAASPTELKPSEREIETESQVATIRALVEHGAIVNVYHPGANRGDGPLHEAAWLGFAETVKFLLANGAEIERANFWGQTPLMTASIAGRSRVVWILLSAGADPNHRTRLGTALLRTAELIQDEAEQRLKKRIGFIPADRKLQQGRIESMRVLLKAGANPKLTNADGKNAYDYARHPAVVRLLKKEKEQ